MRSISSPSRIARHVKSSEVRDIVSRSPSVATRNHRRGAAQKETDTECCVCFHGCDTCTPCGHLLCKTCWDRLPQRSCPICRCELPVSAGAMSSRLCQNYQRRVSTRSRVSTPVLPELPKANGRGSSPITRRNNSRPSSACAAGLQICDLKSLPSRHAQQIRNFARMQSLPESQFQSLLVCAEMLLPYLKADAGEAAHQAALFARNLLSQLAARSLIEMPLTDIALVVPGYASALSREELLADVVIDGIRRGVLHSLQNCGIGSAGFRWKEAEEFILNLVAFGKHDVLHELVEDMAVYAARQVFDVVKLTSLEKLPDAIRRAEEMIALWPSAKQEYTMVLRHWVQAQLQLLLSKMSMSGGPTSARQSNSKEPAWMQFVWWLDTLRAVATLGLFDGAYLRELCDGLLSFFASEGVTISTFEDVCSKLSRNGSFNIIGHDLRPGVLARELMTRPAQLRYMPSMSVILINCPSGSNSHLESVLLST